MGSSLEELIADHNRLEIIEPEALDGLRKLVVSYNPLSGKIAKHRLPALEYYDFRKTNLDTPDAELTPAVKKGWLPIKPAVIDNVPKKYSKTFPSLF